jgi:hypothetical protein
VSAFPVKRPGWFLRFFIRLEDFTNPLDNDAQSEDHPYNPAGKTIDQLSAAETRAAINRAASAVLRTHSDQVQIQAQKDILALRRHLKNVKTEAKPVAGDAGAGDEYSIEFATVPLSLDIEDKGFRHAAELTAEFPFIDLPLDPRVIRECRVEAWIGVIPAADFASPDKWMLSAVPSSQRVLRFNGYIDLGETTHNETEGTLHIKARSYEAVLIDGKINSMASAYRVQGKSEAITVYVNRILAQYPPTSGGKGGDQFRAYWYGDPMKEPLLDRKTLVRSLQTAASRNAAAGSTGQSTPTPQPDQDNPQPDPHGAGDSAPGGSPAVVPGAMKEDGISIWDLVTQACELCGCIPMYRPSLPNPLVVSSRGRTGSVDPANCLLLVPPEAFFDDISHGTTIVGGARDGFSRTLTVQDSQEPIKSDVRFMVWGHNVKSMKLSRKYNRARPTAVEIRAYNPDASDTLRVMTSRFPPVYTKAKGQKGKRHTRMTEKGGGKIDVVRTFIMRGVRDQLALDQAAISTYHQLCRPELSIELDTDELSSYYDPLASQQNGTLVSSDNIDPDLFRLCPGTPVHVAVARKQDTGGLVISSLSAFYDRKGQSTEAMIRQAATRWGNQPSDDKLDQAIARIKKAYETAKLPEVFYCRAVHLHFSAESDFFSAKIELVNYLDAMNAPEQISPEAREMNERRKIHKTMALAKQKAAQDAKTAELKRAASLESLGKGKAA